MDGVGDICTDNSVRSQDCHEKCATSGSQTMTVPSRVAKRDDSSMEHR